MFRKREANSLIDIIINRYKTPYLQALDERNLVRNRTTSWETAGISGENDGITVRCGDSGVSPSIVWMVRWDAETC